MPDYRYAYPRPAVTVDVVLFTISGGSLRLPLIERARDPFAGRWALPGGFVDVGPMAEEQGEQLETAARRELLEETGLSVGPLFQLGAVGTPGRDPRGRTISVVYWALEPSGRLAGARAGDDAAALRWARLEGPSARPDVELAFDHGAIVEQAVAELRRRVQTQPVVGRLLPELFSLADLQAVYSAILGRPVDARSFRTRALRRGLIESTQEREAGSQGRTRLYRLGPGAFDDF